MPGGEMNCLSSGTPPVSIGCVCVSAGGGDHSLSFCLIHGAQRCQKLIRLNHLLFKSITVLRDRVITADYLGSKGSNIIGEDITPRWDMNI